MNHCVLEVVVKKAPTVRYTKDNQTPIAEMDVCFEGLRADDPPGELKVVGWGNLAQNLQNRIDAGQKLVVEGRLRMNTIPRQDGTKEKRAELTLSRIHLISGNSRQNIAPVDFPPSPQSSSKTISPQEKSEKSNEIQPNQENLEWNSSPLVPDTDEIPF